MRQAILITAYRDIPLLTRLINYFDGDFEVFVHLDKKCAEQTIHLQKMSNVHLYKKYKIAWGDVNHLKAIILLMREAHNHTDLEYFHLITGSDYPCMPLQNFKNFCKEHRHDNFVEHFPLPTPMWGNEGGLQRIQYFWLQPSARVKHGRWIEKSIKWQRRLGIRRPFNHFDGRLYGGGTYWSVGREAVGVALNYLDAHPDYLRRFRWTSIAEEICLPTLWAGIGMPMRNDYKRYIDWGSDGANPQVLTEKDYDRIIISGALFARKMQSGVSDSLLNMLDTLCDSPSSYPSTT